MTSKQEKLAAARRKLKEFQGKSKETDTSRQKVLNKDLSIGNNNFCTKPSQYETEYVDKHQHNSYLNPARSLESDEKFEEAIKDPKESPTAFPIQPNHLFLDENKCSNSSDEKLPKTAMESDVSKSAALVHDFFAESNEPPMFHNVVNKTDLTTTIREPKVENINFSIQKIEDENRSYNYNSQFESNSFKENSNNAVQPLQEELKNYAQTINVLIYQRNEIQNSLVQAQSLLKEKTEEVEKLKEHLLNTDTNLHLLNRKIIENEQLIKNLTFEKEEILGKNIEIVALQDSLQSKFDSKEEEYIELQRKFEEKNKECEQYFLNLQRTQSQLSLYQIQLQQLSTNDSSSLTVKVSELQNENLNLSQKIKELEQKIEASNEESEQSSQKFHTYAQQCNSQLASLNTQIETLKKENETLRKSNEVLVKDLSEMENSKKENPQQHNIEISKLRNEIHSLVEENNDLRNHLNKKDDEIKQISDELKEKFLMLGNMEKLVEDVKTENKKLILEAKSPEANERLLAAMESDKVAAAKAVSQNQKLKNQVLELEKAFLKMSEEKLKLTDELAHERHVTAELQKLLKSAESSNQCDDHFNHSDSKCHHNHDQEPLVNDSNEIEELRNIIRQLQDDKVELKARLNTFERNELEMDESTTKLKQEKENQDQCENTNLLLQQMEEKVRKTMNEIAVLDEEKEKLEHLVLQLQGETETIGEYITLYQKQRMLLRQRAQEKDKELLQLSKDKEELRSKLATLDELVQHLIVERQNLGLPSESVPNSVQKSSERTAGKIRELINEIGSTSLVKNHTVAFEHCSCCSGRLITL